MDFTGSGFKKTQRPLIPNGQQIGICYSIIDMGTQEKKNFKTGDPEFKRQLYMSFEFPKYRFVYREELGEQVAAHHETYNQSRHEKSGLMKLLNNWRGKTYLDNEPINLEIYLGKAIMMNFGSKPDKNRKDDDTGEPLFWQEVLGEPSQVAPEMREIYEAKKLLVRVNPAKTVYKTENVKIYFDLDHFDQQVFNSLNNWMKKKIATSPQFKQLVEKGIANPYIEEQKIQANNTDVKLQTNRTTPGKPAAKQFISEPSLDVSEDEIDF